MNTMTVAQRIFDIYTPDGAQVWRRGSRHLLNTASRFCQIRQVRDGVQRFIFQDGSAILSADWWWDIEAEGHGWVERITALEEYRQARD